MLKTGFYFFIWAVSRDLLCRIEMANYCLSAYCESPVCRDQERKSLYRVIYLSKDQAISEKVRRVLDEEWIIV